MNILQRRLTKALRCKATRKSYVQSPLGAKDIIFNTDFQETQSVGLTLISDIHTPSRMLNHTVRK